MSDVRNSVVRPRQRLSYTCARAKAIATMQREQKTVRGSLLPARKIALPASTVPRNPSHSSKTRRKVDQDATIGTTSMAFMQISIICWRAGLETRWEVTARCTNPIKACDSFSSSFSLRSWPLGSLTGLCPCTTEPKEPTSQCLGKTT